MSDINETRKEYLALYALIALLIFQCAAHIFLWVNDFNALSTDEYLRLYFSASWARFPKLFIPGEFLPFYFYFYGLAIKMLGNIIWAGRIITLLFGLLFSIYFYRLSCLITGNKIAAVSSLAIIMASALFLRITSVPLSEIIALALIAFSIFYLFKWSEKLDNRVKSLSPLLLSQISLFMACGIRYECWLIALGSLVFIIFTLVKRNPPFKTLSASLIIGLLPLVFPLFWLIMGKVYFTDSTKFIPTTPPTSQGIVDNLLLYPKFLLAYYPLVLILLIPLFIFHKELYKDRMRSFFSLFSKIFVLFLVYISVRYHKSHMILPERTLLFPLFFLIPLLTYTCGLFMSQTKRVKYNKVIIPVVLVFFLSISFLRFSKLPDPPLPDAKRAGRLVGEIAKREGSAFKNIIVEKTGWDWCVFYVESNLFGRVFFDRPSIIGKSMDSVPSNLLSMGRKDIEAIVKEAQISAFVIKDTKIADRIRSLIPIESTLKIGDFSVLRVQ